MNTKPKNCGLVFAGLLTACMASSLASAQAEYVLRPPSEQIALARDICSNVMRITPGFVPFDACVESLAQTLKEQSATLVESDATSAINRPQQTSYTESRPAERRRKEEYACARLGIAPGTVGFGQCVAGLDSALRGTEQSE